jgi:Type VI secretion system (T6SS), amidase effector protein 4
VANGVWKFPNLELKENTVANNLPSFQKLKSHYPTDSDPEKVKEDIGGAVDASWITNTCVIRVSKAFNYTGDTEDEIPKQDGLLTVKGADKKNYAIRVEEFIHFLRDEFGPPDVVRSDANISIAAFQNKTGIIAWHVSGWSDATGHFTLWDGSSGLYLGGHDYWNFPTSKPDVGPWLTKVELWQC